MTFNPFDAVTSALPRGVSLIEASAGTGKTYTIAMLVLRLVVEFEIPVNKILVVTFTKAATEELKDRIRRRLAEVKQMVSHSAEREDKTISEWLARLPLSRDTIEDRLNLALFDIDQAGIFTIHGFCQRVLKEHALSAGQLFDAELAEDITALRQACADDFWRREIQTRNAWEVSVLTRHFDSPGQLLGSVAVVPDDAKIWPADIDLADVLETLRHAVESAGHTLRSNREKLESAFEGANFKAVFQNDYLTLIDGLSAWLDGTSLRTPSDKALALFTTGGLLEGLNGNQFRSNKSGQSDVRKAEFIASLAIETQPFDSVVASMQALSVVLRRSLLEFMRVELDKRLEQQNRWSFDNLIAQVAKALSGNRSHSLIDELRQRFHAALIDEFQDTDKNQWQIFSALFAVESHYLFLVGDPKQAIYKFRGADIYSYIEAQRHTQHRFTLDKNWRSHPDLVAAVNRLFQTHNAFMLPDIEFHGCKPALSEDAGALVHHDAACPPMVFWQLPESSSKSGFWQPNRNDAAEFLQTAVVNEIVGLLNGSYRFEFISERKTRPVKPQDIAILVRTNRQAKEYQDALRLAGVPSVLNNTDSVFATEEAVQLYTLLSAIAHPGDLRRLSQALALPWFGHDGQALYRILHSEAELDKRLSDFLAYYQLWLNRSLMAMMQTLLEQERIVQILSQSALAERRITNLQHLAELVQQAAADRRLGIHKTVAWLKTSITSAHNNHLSDTQQLRLESDADAVKILTMHRAKGLEFPIVFCPSLWQSDRAGNGKNPFVKCHMPDADGQSYESIVDIGSDRLESHRNQAEFEEKAENIRLAYVALTRAKYRCYIAWANARTADKANDSPLARLLNLAEEDYSGQQNRLLTFAQENDHAFTYRLLPLSAGIDDSYRQSDAAVRLSAVQRHRQRFSSWQMSSYTALTALTLADTPEIPNGKAEESYGRAEDWVQGLPAGAQTGHVVHELLETGVFADLARKRLCSLLRDKVCQRYGLKPEQPGMIDELLYHTVTTPLSEDDPKFTLMNIPERRCIKEMPFYLTIAAFDTSRLNEILRSEPTVQTLTYRQLQGFLTGFIDLICEYEGRFFVMDYKTNSLPDYRPDTLIHAMHEHNYGLQYWLYSLVLHRYLNQRLPGYRYQDHFGGVRYLFVRGMQSAVPMSGVFQTVPDLKILDMLSALFVS